MKNNKVNPKRLKEGVVYKVTRRITGNEYWRFVMSGVADNVWRDNRYLFRQVHGNHLSNGITDFFTSIDMMYMFYTNKKDRALLKKLGRKSK